MESVISFFRSPITNLKPSKTLGLEEVYSLIKDNTYLAATSRLRSCADKNAAKEFKSKSLDYVCFSGTFATRSNSGLIKHSGLLCLDFDDLQLELIDEIKNVMINDPNLNTRLLFRSPSGNGLKWVVDIDLSKCNHLTWFNGISKYMQVTYGLVADKSGKDISRACFLCCDPLAYYSPNAGVRNTFNPSDYVESNSNKRFAFSQSDDERFETIFGRIISAHVDIAPTYDDWLRLGFALASEFGEKGRSYFHALSMLHVGYNHKDADVKYDECLKSNHNEVGIGTLYSFAKSAGVDISYDDTYIDVIEVLDLLNKCNFNKDKKEIVIREKTQKLANEYYQQLTNMYSIDELMLLLGEDYDVAIKENRILISKGCRICYLNEVLSADELKKQCCLKHVAMLYDVLMDGFSFNFTYEDYLQWVIDEKPQTIYSGYYYDKTDHCYKSEFGNSYYCIENEISTRLKNLFRSCLNIQKRKFSDIEKSIPSICEHLKKKMYITKDIDFTDVTLGYYQDRLIDNKKIDSEAMHDFFHELFTCSDDDIESLIFYIAATMRVHFFGDVKYYYCLALTGDSGIGKDSFFPSFCCGVDFMADEKFNDLVYKGSLFGTTKFSTIDEASANKMLYNWVSDDIEAANAVNKLDLINNPLFKVERKGKDNSVMIKRFNTAITANFKDLIFGKNYDINAINRRFLFADFRYRNGWTSSDYVNYYVSNHNKLIKYYRDCFAWIYNHLATNEKKMQIIRDEKARIQKHLVSDAIYKSEEDYQVWEVFDEYYRQQLNDYSDLVIDFKGGRWCIITDINSFHNIFARLRYIPSARKVSKTLAIFYGDDNVAYNQPIYRHGQRQRALILVKMNDKK